MSFNTVKKLAYWAQEYGFITVTSTGYQFISAEKISDKYTLLYPGQEVSYKSLTINPHKESLEHILKTLVLGENFDRQEYVILQKIRRIPGINEKLSKYIHNWQKMAPKELLRQIVLWQKQTFLNYAKGTDAYDLFHSIHADIALTCKRIGLHFCYKSKQSTLYIKKVLKELQYISVEKRVITGPRKQVATRKPREQDGACKLLNFVYNPATDERTWNMPDLITLNLKNL